MHTPRLCCELYFCEIVTSQFQFSPVSFLLSSTIDLNSGANIKQQTSTLSVVQHSYLGLDWTTGMQWAYHALTTTTTTTTEPFSPNSQAIWGRLGLSMHFM